MGSPLGGAAITTEVRRYDWRRELEKITAEFERAFHAAMYRQIQTVVLPRVRARTPVRTRKLRKSLRLAFRKGGGVAVRGQFYGVLLARVSGVPLVRKIFFEELARHWEKMVNAAVYKASRRVG